MTKDAPRPILNAAVVGIALVALAAACGGAARRPVVPIRIQHAIKKRTSVYDYVPTSMPKAFRYSSWSFSHNALTTFFQEQGAAAGNDISFSAFTRPGKLCANSPMRTFQTSSGTIYWSRSNFDQEAWRCVAGPNDSLIQLTAASTAGVATAKTLALIAASGRKIS